MGSMLETSDDAFNDEERSCLEVGDMQMAIKKEASFQTLRPRQQMFDRPSALAPRQWCYESKLLLGR
jgi:hypothetical protein